MTDPRETLARIRAQADTATDGPWKAEGGFVEPSRADLPTIVECSDPEDHDVNNAEFIAASRTDVPRLVSALEAVLDLHAERPYGCVVCEEMGQALPWPCPTVTTITTALEEE